MTKEELKPIGVSKYTVTENGNVIKDKLKQEAEEELEEYENKIVMQEKSKLQKEAENYLNQNCERWESDSLCVDDIAIENYIASAEPREKQIQIDAERIRALQKRNGELTDKVKELEAQIEKMKCCGNCSKNGHICVAEEMQGKLCGKNKDKWELRRKKKMTKEELKQKAYEYAIKEIPFIECITQNDLEILVQQAYITGAEPREKRIEELEAQIEKMKCCENCKHSDTECEGHIVCNKGHFFDCLSNKIFDHTTEEKDYWEIKESE